MSDVSDELCCICAACTKLFVLSADDEVKGERTYVKIHACESGGIYSTYVECPHCGHDHDLHRR